ncbi:MAG: DUF6702 family protein [Bacteroidota bacterium]|jgi:hypothetical protein
MPAWKRNIGLSLILFFCLSAAIKTDHPFHVAVVEIEHNAKDWTLELSCKLFTDDFENALRTRFQVAIDLSAPAKKNAMDSLIARYVREQLVLSVNGKKINGTYLGFEQDKEAIYAFVEYASPAPPQQLQADCGLLYEQFTDQINIFHVMVGGRRQSSKLNHPARQIEFRF